MTITRARPEIQGNESWTNRVITLLNQVRRGRLNNGGDVTLTANAATTTLNDPLITTNSGIFLMPKSANAAAALATTYFSNPTPGSIIINHASNAQVDKTYVYGVFF